LGILTATGAMCSNQSGIDRHRTFIGASLDFSVPLSRRRAQKSRRARRAEAAAAAAASRLCQEEPAVRFPEDPG
jgi:hypothetical protein